MADPNSRFYGAAADYNRPSGQNLLPRIALLVGALLVVIILIGVAFQIIGAISSGPRKELEQLIAREQSISSFTQQYQSFINDSELAKTNSEATIFTSSDATTLFSLLTSQFGATEIEESILTLETDTTSATKLETARQTGRFNDEYRLVLQGKVAAAIQLAETVQQNSNEELNAAIQQTITNLQAIEADL